jgi:hypothetical protein
MHGPGIDAQRRREVGRAPHFTPVAGVVFDVSLVAVDPSVAWPMARVVVE